MQVPLTPGRHRFDFTTLPADWVACLGCGATCAAAWAWFHFTFAMRHVRRERPWCRGFRLRGFCLTKGGCLKVASAFRPARTSQTPIRGGLCTCWVLLLIPDGRRRLSVCPSKAAP